jgi:cytochrome c5
MIRISLLALVLAAGCSPANNEQEAGAGAGEQDPIAGQRAYQKACARCHDEGMEGAPALDDPDAWEVRSSLWMAVLAEHAKDGYLDMPAKGGDPELTDENIEAAIVYMMTLIHPDRPPD